MPSSQSSTGSCGAWRTTTCGTSVASHTLQTTALVHEAYLRLADLDRMEWRERAHFFAMAATLMRRILVDHARDRARDKRGGGIVFTSLNDKPIAAA